MPGLKELEHFRDELSKLGNEREVTAERGEVYEELPRPTAISPAAPQIDVDDLLASLGDTSGADTPPVSEDLSGFDELLASLPLGTAAAAPIPAPKPAAPGAKPAVAPKPAAKTAKPAAARPVSETAATSATPTAAAKPAARASSPKVEPLSPKAPPETFDIPELNDLPESFSMPDFDTGTVPDALLSGFANEIEESRKEPEDFTMPDFSSDFLSEIPQPEDSSAAPFAGFDAFPEPDALSAIEEIPEAEALDEISDELGAAGEPVDAIAGLDALLAAGLPATGESEPEAMDFTPSFEIENLSEAEIGASAMPENVVPAATSSGGRSFEPVDFDTEDFGAGKFDTSDTMPESGIPDDFSGFGASGESSAAPEGAVPDDLFAGLDIPVPDFGPESPSAAASPSPFGEDFNDFSIPDDLNIAEPDGGSAAGETPELDGFDGFSLDEDFLKTSIGGNAGESEDFHIPGFSDFTSASSKSSMAEISAASDSLLKGGKKEVPLKISEKDFARFLELLAAYPLNLRIAIEEFLSGDAGTELQKMELVHNILGQIPVRKIAKSMETVLDRSIPIPRDFEKKNVSDYEREKSSLKYVFMNRILPAATLFTIIAVLAACTVFLVKTFVYEPVVAELLYSSGYAAIADARYTQSESLFDEAVTHWDRKSWYFRYAQAYRDKKQYISAEMMYERLLDRFGNDKKAGLEYAEMLRTDLRNFEKAETILKRRLLDNFVNDKDALLLLGDTYLDWADEAPEKFEAARQTYATLIQLYGNLDPYLARMMRFFIRTDKLAEVLPLKEHFMSKRAKIGAPDLVELSGYLLEKRYNPAPGDSEHLRNLIEDVRPLLERAVKADDSVPEAHYNIGKFFIYNYKNTLASTALNETLRLFESAKTMSPRRVFAHVDTYRLLGEVCTQNKEYLKAQTLYADGITLYEAQRANRSVNQDSRIGTLYADFADIDYFVSENLDSALMNYTRSTEELHDTPSIRYRMGYVQYQKQDYESAMQSFLRAHADVPNDRNLQYGFANTFFRRGDVFAAQGYYDTLMDSLEAERLRKGILFPQVRRDQTQFVEQYMHTANNLGVALNRIALRTGDSQKNARAFALFSESIRAWDALTRDQMTMAGAQGANLALLNLQNMTHPFSNFQPEIYADIPKTLQNEKILKQTEDE